VFFCVECEGVYDAPVQIRYEMSLRGKRILKNFLDAHDHGSKAKMDREDRQWREEVERIREIFRSNPGIGFEEAQRIYEEEELDRSKRA
jgi:hypothetical protein